MAVHYKVTYKFKVQGELEVSCARELERTQRLMEIGQKFIIRGLLLTKSEIT